MVKITRNKSDWKRIGEAIVIWTGWRQSAHPLREETLLIKHFGESTTALLLPAVLELEEAFYSSDARHIAIDLPEMVKIASYQFKEKYPEISDDAVDALAWCYTYDYK